MEERGKVIVSVRYLNKAHHLLIEAEDLPTRAI